MKLNISFLKNVIIITLLIITAYLYYQLNSPKVKEAQSEWEILPVCSVDDLTSINFLLNTLDGALPKARAVVALKSSECLKTYPNLVKSAEVVINKEKEIIKKEKNVEVVSVEDIIEFEKSDILRLSGPSNAEKDSDALELTNLLSNFLDELKLRSNKELDKYFEE